MEYIIGAVPVVLLLTHMMAYYSGRRRGIEDERQRDSFRKAYRERTEVLEKQK